MLNGYMGKLLRVDLSGKTLRDEPLDEGVARDFLGGAGYAAYIINNEVPGDADPLGPANKLVFMTGPATATSLPTTARYEVCTKSPLTNQWLDASSSGWWARDFKLAGYDGIIVEGQSDAPVYLWINDGKAELRDASALWGLDSDQTQEAIRAELGDEKIKVACIGPAGEKLVPLASVMNDEQRAAGRGGAGAVMGSKKLKAIAVRGNGKVPVADEAKLREISKELRARLGGHPVVSNFTPYGTAFLMEHGWVSGDVPNQNWGKGVWQHGCESLNGRVMAETILKPHAACQGCFIRCARWIKIEEGPFAMEGPGPEYETLAAFGTMVMNDNLEAVCVANDLSNRYGVDTISTGAAIAFAMEAYEKGVITKEQAGCELTWGNIDAIIEMVKQIGEARGLGAILGKGVKRAARELGQGTEDYAVHVKGMEVPYHDPRAYFSMATTYATGPRGACHMHGSSFIMEQGGPRPDTGIPMELDRFANEGKGLIAKLAQDKYSMTGSMVICVMLSDGMIFADYAAVLEAITGEPWTVERVAQTGERITNLQRVFSMKCGITGADDTLPKRLLEGPTEGSHAGKVPDLSILIPDYYQERGWDERGRPTAAKLEELGLAEIAGKF
ncbi:MAG: aldehyde ferredoxin oxidoreductase family protein [Thermoleophilia bacterium]|nr:aldehyde ferredoxin oxidoreductase family protein [Thermoleophilia bacterium]